MWQYANLFIDKKFFHKRGDNTQCHENALWEQHAFVGVQKDILSESGADSFYIDSTRDSTPFVALAPA